MIKLTNNENQPSKTRYAGEKSHELSLNDKEEKNFLEFKQTMWIISNPKPVIRKHLPELFSRSAPLYPLFHTLLV